MLDLEDLPSLLSISSAAEFYDRNKKIICLNHNPKMTNISLT